MRARARMQGQQRPGGISAGVGGGLSIGVGSMYRGDNARITAGLRKANTGDGNDFQARYDLGKLIGRGSFSVVRLGKVKSTGEVRAIKIIDKHAVGFVGLREVEKEAKESESREREQRAESRQQDGGAL